MSDEPPSCPDCGAKWIRSGPYYNILGELSDMRVTEATDKYFSNRDKYRADTVRVFKCGNKIVLDDSREDSDT